MVEGTLHLSTIVCISQVVVPSTRGYHLFWTEQGGSRKSSLLQLYVLSTGQSSVCALGRTQGITTSAVTYSVIKTCFVLLHPGPRSYKAGIYIKVFWPTREHSGVVFYTHEISLQGVC